MDDLLSSIRKLVAEGERAPPVERLARRPGAVRPTRSERTASLDEEIGRSLASALDMAAREAAADEAKTPAGETPARTPAARTTAARETAARETAARETAARETAARETAAREAATAQSTRRRPAMLLRGGEECRSRARRPAGPFVPAAEIGTRPSEIDTQPAKERSAALFGATGAAGGAEAAVDGQPAPRTSEAFAGPALDGQRLRGRLPHAASGGVEELGSAWRPAAAWRAPPPDHDGAAQVARPAEPRPRGNPDEPVWHPRSGEPADSCASTTGNLARAPNTLISAPTRQGVGSAFDQLSRPLTAADPRTLEDLAREMLRPMLKQWLDANLTGIVERQVAREFDSLARGR